MIIKSNFFFLFISFVCLNAQYQDLRFDHITTADGLSKSSVTCILQDDLGFIWFGTFNGLNRYDGYDLTIYRYSKDDPQSLSHNYISSMIKDHQGKLWIGTSDGLNCYNQSKDNFKSFRHNNKDSLSINDNQIEVVFEDSKNRLWIGTRNGGLDLFNSQDESFTHFMHDSENDNSISSNFISEIFEDSKGNLWIGHWNGAIDIYDNNRNAFEHVTFQGQKITYSVITSFAESKGNDLWIGTQGDGIYKIKYEKNKVSKLDHLTYQPGKENRISGNIILSLTIDHNNRLWIGTEDKGLNILDVETGKIYYYKTDPFDPASLNNNSIYSIFEDTIGNFWIGTFAGGVNLFVGGKAHFQFYKHFPGYDNSLSENNINGFWEDDKDNIWIATGGKGLDLFNRRNKSFLHFNSHNSSMAADVILCLYKDSNNTLWIGTWANGLYKFNSSTKKFIQYTKETNGLGSNNIFQIVEGNPGELWLCTFWGGLTRFDTKDNSSIVFNSANSQLSDNDLRAIAKDYEGNLWIGSDVGLDLFNPKTKVFKSYLHHSNDPNSLSKGFVSYVMQSMDSTLWVGTTGGLNKLDRNTDSFIHYNMKDGLSHDEVSCIIEDERGVLWISTTKGISRLDPKTESFKNYNASDGLQGMEFNTRSGFKTKKGEILFGCNTGFNIFQPEKIKDNPNIPPVIIDEFKIFNKPVKIGGKDSPLEKNIIETKELVLSYKQSVFSFNFVALNYASPKKNQYAYMMEGFDKSWNYIGLNRTATYTNLDPGDYVFRVKASNNDKIWNEKGAAIKITIEPPFWKTWWAYTIESFLFLMIVYFILNYYISRQRLRNALKIEHLELEKMYELDHIKTQFFTNISHEFQSPITLILSPLERLITSTKIDEKVKNSLALIHRNAKRLQRMTNQLKDFNKIETEDLQLFLSKGDIICFIEDIAHSFKDYAKEHHIDFKFSSKNEQWIAWFDPDKLDKIIYNLLSNAFKFTPDDGNIEMNVSVIFSDANAIAPNGRDKASKYIEISVKDSGIGIPEDKIENIFKRFYHLENYNGHYYEGSGVGLAFVYELLNLYRGEISVSSKEGKGATFTVQIPIDEHYLEENQLVGEFNISAVDHTYINTDVISNLALTKSRKKQHDLPVMLIVEDDKEIREYIKNSFDTNYRIIEAENGLEGFKKVTQTIPDLIITDIKMQGIDGIELCKKLKNDEKTSHIPIIMLTGYSSREYQLKGLTEGVDAYLTKPFNIDVLEAHITNILDTRKKLQKKFSSEIIFGPEKIPLDDIDARFLKRLTEIIESHISDNNFNADVLSEKIGMSRMQLYRKLRGLTNQTVHEFIRSIRLKRAVQLLEQKRMTITEIAYEVGFNDLTYFARCFRKQYDKSPSEYISNKK